MKLTAKQIESAKSREKDYKLVDGMGLFLLVKVNGAKYWLYRYTFRGKEKLLALGVYPSITLSVARELRAEAKALVAAGEDPVIAKKKSTTPVITFREMAEEWHDYLRDPPHFLLLK